MSSVPHLGGAESAAFMKRRTWGEDRRLVGQLNVGFWVLASAAVLAWQPALPDVGPFETWALICMMTIGLQFPFDLWGGFVLPTRHGRSVRRFGHWASAWLAGVLVYTSVLFACGALLMGASSRFGAAGALGIAAGSFVVLIAAQAPLSAAVGYLASTVSSRRVRRLAYRAGLDPALVRVCRSDDVSFVGGWLGLPALETLVLPRRWVDQLSDDSLVAALVRRQVALESGRRGLGVGAAGAFNLAGLALSVLVFLPGGPTSVSQLVVLAAAMTLWGFVGLLTLPRLSRRAVLEIDQEAAAVLSPGQIESLIRTLDRDQDDEWCRGPLTEYIFHPVPTPDNRIAALNGPGRTDKLPTSPWRVTRTALFTSMAFGGLLGRAVHCNIGRPDLWVVFSGD